jgi:hypothetical protein
MTESRDIPQSVSQIEKLTLLLERASERANAAKASDPEEYARLIVDIRHVIRQLQEAFAVNDWGQWGTRPQRLN